MADILLKQANLSEIPLRVLATLPSALPSAGYANLLCQDTVDGKRAFLRLPDGSLVNLYTENVTVDNTVTNNTTIYDISDLPDPSALSANAVLVIVDTGGVKSWGFNYIHTLLVYSAVQAHRLMGMPVTSAPLQKSDIDRYLNCLNTTALTLTLVANATVAWPDYSESEIARNGTGTVTLALAAGVTVNGSNSSISVSKQYGLVVLKRIAIDTWVAYGDIS